MKKYFDTVLTSSGGSTRPLAGATVSVFVSGTDTFATTYLDDEVTVGPNPITVDSEGYFQFKAQPGLYDLQIEYSGKVLKRIDDLNFDGFDAANVNITGGSINGTVIGNTNPANVTAVDLRHTGEMFGGGEA